MPALLRIVALITLVGMTAASPALNSTACSPLTLGHSDVPLIDTPEEFKSYIRFKYSHDPVPDGYSELFYNWNAVLNVSGMSAGSIELPEHDPAVCAKFCNEDPECKVFDLYYERGPSIVPGPACPNPSPTTHIKCDLWKAVLGVSDSLNFGYYLENFHVIMVGSDAYIKDNKTAAVTSAKRDARVDDEGVVLDALVAAIEMVDIDALTNALIDPIASIQSDHLPSVLADAILRGAPHATSKTITKTPRGDVPATITIGAGFEATAYSNGNIIRAPLDCNGQDTYLGVEMYDDGKFDASRCVEICRVATGCHFVNTWALRKNGAMLEQHCALYSKVWPNEFLARIRDDVRHVEATDSYGFTVNDGQDHRACVPAKA